MTVSGKLAKWKRHADQLRKCYDSNNFTDITPETVVSQEVEEEEEEKENSSEVIVYGNFASPQQMTTQTTVAQRNPPRNR